MMISNRCVSLTRVALAIPNTENGRSKCSMYAVDFTEVLRNGVINQENWPEKPCSHGWEYNKTEIPYETISTKVGWNVKVTVCV